MNKVIGALCVGFATAVGATTPQHPDPNALLAQIAKEGARPVLQRLWNDEAAFDAVCNAIETAEPSWLNVAQQLRSASDAASTLSLNYSVARALPKAPERVLALIGQGFEIHDICSSPYIEPEHGEAEKYQREAVKALKKVTTPQLVEVRDKCLAGVNVPLVAQ